MGEGKKQETAAILLQIRMKNFPADVRGKLFVTSKLEDLFLHPTTTRVFVAIFMTNKTSGRSNFQKVIITK